MEGAWKDLRQAAVSVTRATRVLRSPPLAAGQVAPEGLGNPLDLLRGTGVQNNTRSVEDQVTLVMRPCMAAVDVGPGTYFGPLAPTTAISRGGGLGVF